MMFDLSRIVKMKHCHRLLSHFRGIWRTMSHLQGEPYADSDVGDGSGGDGGGIDDGGLRADGARAEPP
jgi:hypothetical protein